MRYKQRDNLTVQSVDDETLILDIEGNNIHQLNFTASFIWSLCVEEVSMDQLAELYAEHFQIEHATAKRDVENVINQLTEIGLIKVT